MTLYQLLMEERYGEPIEAGLLWYLNQASPEIVTRSPYEVRITDLKLDSYMRLKAVEGNSTASRMWPLCTSCLRGHSQGPQHCANFL